MRQEIRYAFRSFRRDLRSFFIATVLLALGIGANAAIFSFIDGTLLKPLNYPHPSEIVNIWEKPPDGIRNRTSSLTFLDWRKESSLFTEMAAEAVTPLTLSGEGEPVILHGDRVSANYFRIFGVQPTIGRTFVRDEETTGKDQVAVISNRVWQSRFGGDPKAVGRRITLAGKSFLLIGVMPAGSSIRSRLARCLDSSSIRAIRTESGFSLATSLGASTAGYEPGTLPRANEGTSSLHVGSLSAFK